MSLNKTKLFLFFFSIISFGHAYLFPVDSPNNRNIRIVCSDDDYEKPITEPILHIKIYKHNEVIQTINYVYQDPFMLIKHFDLIDINFDGFTDILIKAGLTPNRGQPYYDAYLWSPTKKQFVYTNEIADSMPNLRVDAKKHLLYSYYMMNDGRKEYHVFKFDNGHYAETGCLQEFNGIFDYPVYLYSNEVFDNNCKFKKLKDLSGEWKRVVAVLGLANEYSE